jgi:hypothetical protein
LGKLIVEKHKGGTRQPNSIGILYTISARACASATPRARRTAESNLSIKTVEGHLARAYGKLDVTTPFGFLNVEAAPPPLERKIGGNFQHLAPSRPASINLAK